MPLIGLRGISDGAADLSHVGDWTEYLHVIDEKLAHAVVGRLEAAIAGRHARRFEPAWLFHGMNGSNRFGGR